MFGGGRMSTGERVEAWDTEKIVAAGLVTLGGALVISRALRSIPALLTGGAAPVDAFAPPAWARLIAPSLRRPLRPRPRSEG